MSIRIWIMGTWNLQWLYHFLLYPQAKATDKDAGKNGQIKYSILARPGERKRFSIAEDTGVVTTLAVLDREDPSGNVVYGLVIKAEDQSTEASKLSGITQ